MQKCIENVQVYKSGNYCKDNEILFNIDEKNKSTNLLALMSTDIWSLFLNFFINVINDLRINIEDNTYELIDYNDRKFHNAKEYFLKTMKIFQNITELTINLGVI